MCYHFSILKHSPIANAVFKSSFYMCSLLSNIYNTHIHKWAKIAVFIVLNVYLQLVSIQKY